MRPGNDAGQKKTDNDWQAHPVAKIEHDDRQQDDDQDIVEVQRVHVITEGEVKRQRKKRRRERDLNPLFNA